MSVTEQEARQIIEATIDSIAQELGIGPAMVLWDENGDCCGFECADDDDYHKLIDRVSSTLPSDFWVVR